MNWAGVALIGLAFALFAGEVFVTGFGALGIGGAVALVAGGLLLTTSDNPEFQVSRWLAVATGVIVSVFFLMVATAIFRMRRLPASSGIEAMIGSRATVRAALDPAGFVWLNGERWRAIADEENVPIGESVTITDVQGLTLHVRRSDSAEAN